MQRRGKESIRMQMQMHNPDDLWVYGWDRKKELGLWQQRKRLYVGVLKEALVVSVQEEEESFQLSVNNWWREYKAVSS